jgi:glycosyltransferase involved in cell wall biosynthesis
MMAQLLIITTLDVLGRRNNREHHAIANLSPKFDRVAVVFRRRGRPGKGLRDLLKDDVEVIRKGAITYYAVDPKLNPPEGAVREFVLSRGGWLRKVLANTLDSAGILRDWLTIRALTHVAKDAAAPDMPVLCEAFGPWAAAAAIRLRKDRVVERTVYVDRDFEPGFMRSPLRRTWAAHVEAKAAAQADLTLSIGHRLAARFAGIAGADVRVSPTGVDGAQFNPRRRTHPAPHLVFVGQVAAWNGIEEVLDAMQQLLPEVPDLRLTVMGPCEEAYRRSLAPRIAALAHHVDWRGDTSRDQVAAAMDAASIGLATFRPHPLRIHATPLKVMEYLASGLPVIALEGSEAGDIVSASGTGLTCKTTGLEIASAIRRMLGDPVGYARMSEAGPLLAGDHEWSKVFDREYALVTRAVQGGSQEAVA